MQFGARCPLYAFHTIASYLTRSAVVKKASLLPAVPSPAFFHDIEPEGAAVRHMEDQRPIPPLGAHAARVHRDLREPSPPDRRAPLLHAKCLRGSAVQSHTKS